MNSAITTYAMRKTLLTATIFLHAIAAFAQNTELEVVNLKSEYKYESEFPEVRCKSNPKVAEKINIFLQVKELEMVPIKNILLKMLLMMRANLTLCIL